MPAQPAHKRILLKLSGEALMGDDAFGINRATIVRMVEGRLRKYLAEICLTGQPFVKDPDTSVGALLEKSKAAVSGFLRFEVGEGIEKKQENFAAEVMAQVEAAKGRA